MQIKSFFPCCKGQCRFTAHAVPKEMYSRTCPKCGQPWEVTRRQIGIETSTSGIRIDKLDWATTEVVHSC